MTEVIVRVFVDFGRKRTFRKEVRQELSKDAIEELSAILKKDGYELVP